MTMPRRSSGLYLAGLSVSELYALKEPQTFFPRVALSTSATTTVLEDATYLVHQVRALAGLGVMPTIDL